MRFMKTWLIVLAFCSIQIGGIVGCSNPVQTNREKDTIFVVKNSAGEDTTIRQMMKIYSWDTIITDTGHIIIKFPITVSKNYMGIGYYLLYNLIEKDSCWYEIDKYLNYVQLNGWHTNFVNLYIYSHQPIKIRIILFDQI